MNAFNQMIQSLTLEFETQFVQTWRMFHRFRHISCDWMTIPAALPPYMQYMVSISSLYPDTRDRLQQRLATLAVVVLFIIFG